MNENKNTKKFLNVIISFLIIYFAGGNRLPNWFFTAVGGVLLLYLLWKQKSWKIDLGFCLLAIALGSYYGIVHGIRGLFFMILYLPLFFYLLAEHSAVEFRKMGTCEAKEGITVLSMTLICGFALHGILNAYMYYAGYVVPGTRRWHDFFTGEIVPGTQHTAYFLPVLAVVVPAVLYFKSSKKDWWLRVLGGLTAIFFLYTSLATRSRMPLVIFVIVGGLQVLLFCIFEKEKVRKLCRDQRFWAVVLLFCAAAVIGIFLVKDSAVIVAFIENMGKGGGILNNVRFQAQRQALLQLFDHPLGGRQMELGRTYCHNTWLDMANAGGVIPFFAFAAYTVSSFYQLICLLRKKEFSSELKLAAAGLYMAFFLYMSVEPLFDAPTEFLVPWIYINGLISGLLRKENA